MYRIQGSDNKEYGPIPLETIRQWIGERRLNKDSLACLEGEGVWKPLGQFPEFADLLAAASVAYAAPVGAVGAAPVDPALAHSTATGMVKVPALLMLIFALISAIASVTMGMMSLSGNDVGQILMKSMGINPPQPPPEQLAMQQNFTRISGIVNVVLGPVWNGFVAFGAVRMMRLRSRGLALTASILSVIPCFSICCLITMPIGIWGLVVLCKPEVKSQFT